MNIQVIAPPIRSRVFTSILWSMAAALLVVYPTRAASHFQEGQPEPPAEAAADCKDCHLDVTESWEHSAHAHAFDDPVFQERWHGMGEPGDCLLCHTTNYRSIDDAFTAEGVECQACHGSATQDHPPEPIPILADTQYCGTCHTTTLSEWRLTGHANAGVGCADCHDPHSQEALFEVADEMCLNCHKNDMGDYLEDLHVQKNIGCVDCHALVIPPEMTPDDGIVPTGHTFTITPSTCVACHTDALHAGFSLPGYENGAKVATNGEVVEEQPVSQLTTFVGEKPSPDEQIQTLENELRTSQAALANRSLGVLFQGGLVGLVLGGSTAWFVAQNARQQRREETTDDEG